MNKAVETCTYAFKDSRKNKWVDSKVIARQGAGVFLGGKMHDFPKDNPFKSAKQRKYLYSQKPSVAKKFSKHTM